MFFSNHVSIIQYVQFQIQHLLKFRTKSVELIDTTIFNHYKDTLSKKGTIKLLKVNPWLKVVLTLIVGKIASIIKLKLGLGWVEESVNNLLINSNNLFKKFDEWIEGKTIADLNVVGIVVSLQFSHI